MRRYFVHILTAAFLVVFSNVCFGGGTVSVIRSDGEVRVSRSDGAEEPCRAGMSLGKGSRIRTGEKAYVELAFDSSDKNMVKVGASSDVVLSLGDEDKIELIDGELYALLSGMRKGEKFRVKTPAATCGARGTGWRTLADGDITDVAVFDGKVFVRGVKKDGSPREKGVWLSKGFERRVKRFQDPGRKEKISDARMNRILGQVRFSGRLKKEQQKDKGVKKKARGPGSKDLRGRRAMRPEKISRKRGKTDRYDRYMDKRNLRTRGKRGAVGIRRQVRKVKMDRDRLDDADIIIRKEPVEDNIIREIDNRMRD